MSDDKIFRSAFIAFVGRPNSGKSTLLNTVLEEQLSVVTPLPQTTRRNLRGIYTTDTMQLIFVDTPGIHEGKHVFNESMIKEAKNLVIEKGVDLICYLVDLSRDFGSEEEIVANLVSQSGSKVLIVFNKLNAVPSSVPIVAQFYEKFPQFKDMASIQLSATLA
jgi:GTP-binding protein Era